MFLKFSYPKLGSRRLGSRRPWTLLTALMLVVGLALVPGSSASSAQETIRPIKAGESRQVDRHIGTAKGGHLELDQAGEDALNSDRFWAAFEHHEALGARHEAGPEHGRNARMRAPNSIGFDRAPLLAGNPILDQGQTSDWDWDPIQDLIQDQSLGQPLDQPQEQDQDQDPQLELWLFQRFIGVRTASNTAPLLRVFDAEGNQKSDTSAQGRKSGGRWQIDLNPQARNDSPTLLEPGDRVEVEIAGKVTSLDVPLLSASADVETDHVHGTLPEGALGAAVLLRRNSNFFAEPHIYDAATGLAKADGSYEIDLSGTADIEAGYYGEAFTQIEGGHVLIASFAPPAVIFHAIEPFAVVYGDGGDPPVLTTQDEGTELYYSGPARPLGGANYLAYLGPNGNLDFETYEPQTGVEVVVLKDETPILRAPLPQSLAGYDSQTGELWGHAEPGAVIRVGIPNDTPLDAVAGEDGDFSFDLSGVRIGEDAPLTVVIHEHQGVARATRAVRPRVTSYLYGQEFGGFIAGWGTVLIEQYREGERLTWDEPSPSPDGEFYSELRGPRGEQAVVSPGDRILIRPEIGRQVEIEVPALGGESSADVRSFLGNTTANTPVLMYAYDRSPNFFDNQPYNQVFDRQLETTSDAEGVFNFSCEGEEEDCRYGYGFLGARQGPHLFALKWTNRALFGLSVDAVSTTGRATAGKPVRVIPLGPNDEVLEEQAITSVIRARQRQALPRFDLDLEELFPEGLSVGQGLRVIIGEEITDFRIPEVTWKAQVGANSVVGTGPPSRQMVVLAYARGEADNRPPVVAGNGRSNGSGRWTVRFPNFDLRSGDDIEVYLLGQNFFLWWTEYAIEGIDPPTPTPRPTQPSDRPSPTPGATEEDPRPEEERLFLPRLIAGA